MNKRLDIGLDNEEQRQEVTRELFKLAEIRGLDVQVIEDGGELIIKFVDKPPTPKEEL